MASIIRRAGRRAGSYVVRIGKRAGAVAQSAGRAVIRRAPTGGKTIGEIVGVEAAPSFAGGFAAELESQAAGAIGLSSPGARIAGPLLPAAGIYLLGNMAGGKVRRVAWNFANAHVAVSGQKLANYLSSAA